MRQEKTERKFTRKGLGKAARDVFSYPGTSASFQGVRRLRQQAVRLESQSLGDEATEVKRQVRKKVAETVVTGVSETLMLLSPPFIAALLYGGGVSSLPIAFLTASFYGYKGTRGGVARKIESLRGAADARLDEVEDHVGARLDEVEDHIDALDSAE